MQVEDGALTIDANDGGDVSQDRSFRPERRRRPG
jgi:hypothetical protein